MISIDNNVCDDKFARYKMPIPVLAVVKKKGSDYTSIKNLSAIAKSLQVNENVLFKYLSYELGTSGNSNDHLLKGVHSSKSLETYIRNFIETFVLCGRCRLPELVYSAEKKRLQTSCKSCGHSELCKSEHKVVKEFLKYNS
jgi:translation initiation factor 5